MRRLWKMEYCYSTLGFRQLCKRIELFKEGYDEAMYKNSCKI